MEARTRLESNLVSESEAYGYTLSIWGSGALLIHAFGVPGIARTLAFIGGALAGFAALAVLAFEGLSAEATPPTSPSSLVVSTIHVVATGGTVVAVHFLITAGAGAPPAATFFAVGFVATAVYNLLLLLEAFAVRRVV